jgi:sortase A
VRIREDPLMKAGAVMMAFAIALLVAALVAISVLRAEPERAVASETREPTVEPLKRSKPDVEPWVEKTREPVTMPEPEPKPEPVPQADPKPRPQPEPASQPEPAPQPEPERETSTVAESPPPTDREVEKASEPRHYDLPTGAKMGLTIKALGLHSVPVFDSNGRLALTNGVRHVPGTSLPWSDAPQRNVYIEGHRLGWPGTGSYHVFYSLNTLEEGDEVRLKDRDGRTYRYRVSEKLRVNPDDVWVMGQVRERDMVTLQTCTPIPTFDKRLVVRADRI